MVCFGVGLWLELKALGMLGTLSAPEPHLQPPFKLYLPPISQVGQLRPMDIAPPCPVIPGLQSGGQSFKAMGRLALPREGAGQSASCTA